MAPVAGALVVSGKALSTNITQHCRAINALVTKLDHAERKVDEYQRAIGQHIAAIKKARPDDWEDIVKAECKLGRSRAYELLAIADGRKTVEQTRAEKAESVRRLRARPLRSGRKATTALVKVEQANDSPFQGEEWDSGPPGAADVHPADARRRGFMWRASEAARFARLDDFAGLKVDEEMRKAVKDADRQRSACRVSGHDHEAGHRIQPRRLYKEPAQ